MTLWQDVRFGVRALKKARGLTAIALFTLALGIGANTAIFSIVNAVLLRPLPFRDPGRLIQMRADLTGLSAKNIGFSVPEYEDLRDRAGIFESVAVVWPAPANITGGERPERVDILGVSPNYFEVLGVRPQLGRVFDQRDTANGFAEACVISDGLWHRDFAADPNVLGRKVRLDNDLYTIVGVLPPGFRHPGPASARQVDFWATAGFRADPFPPPARNLRLLPGIIGRLKPGISVQEAQARLASLASTLRHEYAADYPANAAWTLTAETLKGVVVGNSQTLLLSLLLAVALILLIACVNVASLLLARSSVRRREIAVRMALGASRGRVLRQLLTESAVLGLAAAAVGAMAAVLTEKALVGLLPSQLPQVNAITVDGRVLLFTLSIAVITSILFGLAPALQISRPDANALKQDGRSADASLGSSRTRKLLVGAEVALSLMLVVGAGLLLRTFLDLLRVDPGFSPQRVLAASVWLPVPNDPKTDVYRNTEQRTAFIREVLRRMREIPGVENAGISGALPLKTPLAPTGFRVQGESEQGDAPAANIVLVTPDFLHTLGARLVHGRMIQENDDQKIDNVVLVDEAAVRYLWHGRDPVGGRIRFARDFVVKGKTQQAPWMNVVGVVSNIKFSRLDEDETPHIYSSAYQFSGRLFNVVVRASGDPADLGKSIQREIESVDPNLPVSDVAPMTQVVTASVAERRFAAILIAIFAVVALALAAVGVYGVASYTVAQRTREFGIRTALGASASDLLRLVLKDSMAPVLGGLAAGLLGALVGARIISSLLFGVRPTDPAVFLISGTVLVIIGLAANYLPARRAGRVDPNIALRCE
ncbi:MAG TPA: ABC transporter permease [Terriglobales bacterium]|nr:ABC transporter permease [Terriglobales bacterium]